MHGVTKEVVLKIELLGKGTGMKPGTTVSGWDASTALKRSDFGLSWSKVIEEHKSSETCTGELR
jgi:polyisoprenoid-binding protein YceI